MLLYEIRKIWNSRFIRISVIALFVLLGLFVYMKRTSFPEEMNPTQYYEMILGTDGQIKPEVLTYYQELKARDLQLLVINQGRYCESQMGDRTLIKEISEQSAYAREGYAADMSKLVENSLKKSQASADSYERAYYYKSVEVYNQVVEISVIPTENAEQFLELFHGSNAADYGMVLILWTVMITVYTFGWEENEGLAGMIRAASGGRSKLVLAKMAVLTCIVVCACMGLLLAELAVGYQFFGINKMILRASIQSLPSYKLCDIKLNIFSVLFLAGASRMLVLLAVMCVTTFLIGIIRTIPAAFLSILIGEGTLLYLQSMQKTGYMNYIGFMKIRQYVPLALLYATDYLKAFDYGRFICWPVNILWECIAITTVTGLLFAVLAAAGAERINGGKRYGTSGKGSSKEVREEMRAESL